MQIPIITNESLAQMTLMQLTAYVLRLLSEALPHVENIETAETNAKASAEAAAATVNGFDTHVAEKIATVDPLLQAAVDRAVTMGVAKADVQITAAAESASVAAVTVVDNAVENGLDRINAAIETVLTTEV